MWKLVYDPTFTAAKKMKATAKPNHPDIDPDTADQQSSRKPANAHRNFSKKLSQHTGKPTRSSPTTSSTRSTKSTLVNAVANPPTSPVVNTIVAESSAQVVHEITAGGAKRRHNRGTKIAKLTASAPSALEALD